MGTSGKRRERPDADEELFKLYGWQLPGVASFLIGDDKLELEYEAELDRGVTILQHAWPSLWSSRPRDCIDLEALKLCLV